MDKPLEHILGPGFEDGDGRQAFFFYGSKCGVIIGGIKKGVSPPGHGAGIFTAPDRGPAKSSSLMALP
jgi:hypothetical protein